MDTPAILLAATLVLTGIAAITDWRAGVIPNWITLPVVVGAPLAYLGFYGQAGAEHSLTGILGAGLVPYVLFRLEAMGGGDVKLFGALGALHGPALGLEILIASLVLSCVWAVVLLVRRGELSRVLATSAALVRNSVVPRSRRRSIAPASMTELRMAPLVMAASLLVLMWR